MATSTPPQLRTADPPKTPPPAGTLTRIRRMAGHLLERADKRDGGNRPRCDIVIEGVDVLQVVFERRGHNAGKTGQRITNATIIRRRGAAIGSSPAGVIFPTDAVGGQRIRNIRQAWR